MSLFINLTGDARKDKGILANIKRAVGAKAYEGLREDALKLGEVFFAVCALHGNRLDKREWDKLEETEQLRVGALAQKALVFLQDASLCEKCEEKDDGSITVRIPAWLVDAVKGTFPILVSSVLKVPVPTPAPEMVPTPPAGGSPFMGFPFGGVGGDPFDSGSLRDTIDSEIHKIIDEEKA